MMTEESNSSLKDIEKALLARWQKNKTPGVNEDVIDQLKIKVNGEVLVKEPMKKHTYIKVGGPADVLIQPKDQQSIQAVMQICAERNLPVTFHGGGSNTLVRDGGIAGVVLSLYEHFSGVEVIEKTEEEITLRVLAGTPMNSVVKMAKAEKATGLEPFVGIPGSLGGWVKMNAGVPEREIGELVDSVEILDKDLEVRRIKKSKLKFEYRNLGLTRAQLILSADLKLKLTDDENEIENQMKTFQDRRSERQPLNYPNLGSMFQNPDKEKVTPYRTAGQLIEEAGLKGVRVGGARISEKHANFIINEGGATAQDVLALLDLAKTKVKNLCFVELETEVKIVGKD